MKIWKVTINDHSHLGGPMGSEYITALSTKLCMEEQTAWGFIETRLKKDGILSGDRKTFKKWGQNHPWIGISRTKKLNLIADLGHIGIVLEQVEVE